VQVQEPPELPAGPKIYSQDQSHSDDPKPQNRSGEPGKWLNPVEHASTAVAWITLVVVVCVTACIALAEPTELITADDASHVVASFVFLDFGFANWTKSDSTVLVCPSFEFAIHILLTACPTMPFSTALEAYHSRALRAYNLLGVWGLTTHHSWTARLCAPTNQEIRFSLVLFDEISKLLECFWLLFPKEPCQFRHLDFSIALFLKTDELFKVELGDFDANVLARAVNTESVSA
jgi:hypothetical protein